MEWWMFLISFFGLLMIFMFMGMPVAFSFLTVNFIFVTGIMGFNAGMNQIVLSAYDSLAKFPLTTIPLFVIMGELLLHSGLVVKTLDTLSKWMGRIPGRLSVLAVVSGSLFAALSGSSIANTSMLGTVLAPDMRNKGYHKLMILGPIMASGSLAVIMPHSSSAILLGSIGKVSIGDLLIATIIPGILMTIVFIAFIMFICWKNPSLAPAYDVETTSWSDRIRSLMIGVMPTAILITVTILLMFFGVATPTESAALGALGALILIALYRTLTLDVLIKSIKGTLKISSMILVIIAASSAFTQLLAFTGASQKLLNLVLGFEVNPLLIVAIMLLLVIFLGCFIDPISIMMLTLPIYIPMIISLGFDPVWFGILMLICLDMGNLTPPFGLLLFVMKGVSPKDVTMKDVYKSAIPFILLEFLVLILIMFIPQIAIWLPGLSK